MGLLEPKSSPKMAKSASTVKKASSSNTKATKIGAASQGLDFSDPKVLAIVGLLAVLALLVWYGYRNGCLRRRRRRSSC